MIEQLGPVLIFLGILFLIAGLIYYFTLRWRKNKYPQKTYATISSCKKYTLEKGKDTYVYQALIMEFIADNKKNYKVRRDIGRVKRSYSKKNKQYSIGEQVKIYYNPKNPEEIDVPINGSDKVLSILSYVFISFGLFGLLVGSYLTFGNVLY